MNPGTNVTITTPPFFGRELQHVVGHVARHVADRLGRRVREDDRRLAHADRVLHRVGRHVAEIDEHPEPVHLAHDLLAEFRQPAERRLVGRRIRPRHVQAVRQRHVPGAERAHHAQRRQRALDRVAAFHPDHRSDAAVLEGALDLGCRARELERLRPAPRHPVDDVDLLERGAHRLLALHGRRARRPTRTVRRRRPGGAAGCRSSASVRCR